VNADLIQLWQDQREKALYLIIDFFEGLHYCNPGKHGRYLFENVSLARQFMYTKTDLVSGFSRNQILVAVILGQNCFWLFSENNFEMSIIYIKVKTNYIRDLSAQCCG